MLGVLAFSFTVPFTRAVVDGGGMSPMFVGCGRAVLAALLAAAALALTGQRPPRGLQWARLGVVAAGVVAGFPLLSSYALTKVSAGHGAVVIALLPAATAAAAVIRGHERPPRAFWAAALAGAVAAVAFASLQGGSFSGPQWPDLLLLGAVVLAGAGYAEGGLLSRELGSWQTIAWALVLSAPVMTICAGATVAQDPPSGTAAEWAAFGYLGVVSMFLGFFAWYRGLAIGPMAQVGQIQLVQPVMTFCWAALFLGENITWLMILGALAVIACAASAVRVRRGRPAQEAQAEQATVPVR